MFATLLLCVVLPIQGAHQPPAPNIIARSEWGAKPPVIDLVPHHVKYITIHHGGVDRQADRDFFEKLRGLQSWSQRDDELAGGTPKPKWSDIPYHYYIDWDGRIAECRQIIYPGDTNTTYDPWGHALIVLEGNLNKDEFTKEQRDSLYALVTWLSWRHRVPSGLIKGHRDYAQGETDCPGEAAYGDLPNLRSHVARTLGR